MSKPGKVLKGLCKKLGVRLTVKRNGKRVYKSVKVLKEQCKRKVKKKKKKVVKRRRKFGTERNIKRVVYTIGEHHSYNHSHYILDELFKYLKSNNKIPYIFTEYGMLNPREYKHLPDYTNYLTTMFDRNFVKNNVIQIDKKLHELTSTLVKSQLFIKYTCNGLKFSFLFNTTDKNKHKVENNEEFISKLDNINKQNYEILTKISEKPNIKDVTTWKKVEEICDKHDIDSYTKIFTGSDENLVFMKDSAQKAGDEMKKHIDTLENLSIKGIVSEYINNLENFIHSYNKWKIEEDLLKKRFENDDWADIEDYYKLLFCVVICGNRQNEWTKKQFKEINEIFNIGSIEHARTVMLSDYQKMDVSFGQLLYLSILARDKHLQKKIHQKNKSVDKNIPFVIYLGAMHFKNYKYFLNLDYEEINLLGKIQSETPPDNKYFFPLTDTKYYKYRKSYRDLLKDKGIALSTIKLDKAAPGLQDWVEQRRLENKGNYSYHFGKRKRKRKVKRKRKRKVIRRKRKQK